MGSFAAGDTDYIPKLNALQDAALIFSIKSANFSASNGNGYYVSAASVTAQMPSSPVAGNRIVFRSPLGGVASFTIDRNGQPINSAASNYSPAGTNFWLECLYVDATVGWQVRELVGPATVAFSVKTTGFTAAKDNFYAIDASTFTVTLPGSPAAGDSVFLAATTTARTAITLGRNGSNINSAASDYTINGQQWAVELRYVNSTVGWLVITMGTDQALARWDATTKQLRYHDGQRELSAPVGWMPFALPLGAAGGDLANQNSAPGVLAASGGALAIPVMLTGHMLLKSVTVTNSDASLTRTAEWRLYRQALNNGNSSENTLDEVANANGTWSFTAAGAALRTSAASATVYLPPGLYWLVIRNTHASNTFIVNWTATGHVINKAQTKTLGSALGSTLDFVAATWTKQTPVFAASLDGAVFGQTTAF